MPSPTSGTSLSPNDFGATLPCQNPSHGPGDCASPGVCAMPSSLALGMPPRSLLSTTVPKQLLLRRWPRDRTSTCPSE